MYGTSDVKADAGRPQFVVGITENNELTKVAYENSKGDGSGKDVLSMTFTGSNGGTFRKLFWEVDRARTISYNKANKPTHSRTIEKLGAIKGEHVTDEQAVLMAYDEFNRNIKHIMTKYMSDEEATIKNVASYQEFAQAVAKKLTGKIEGKKVRLKTIYNKNGYLDFPRFGNYIESMDSGATSLFLTDYEVNNCLTREEPTKEAEVEVAFSDAPTAKGTNDLPF